MYLLLQRTYKYNFDETLLDSVTQKTFQNALFLLSIFSKINLDDI